MSKEKQQVTTGAEPIIFCGRCERGWLFRADPECLDRCLAYPCWCNARGREEVDKYVQELRLQGFDRQAESSIGAEDTPLGQDAISLFGVAPSERELLESDIRALLARTGGSSALQATRYGATLELARRTVDRDTLGDWRLEDWESFNLEHPQPERELARLGA